jgi:prophage maintenance system killer protein
LTEHLALSDVLALHTQVFEYLGLPPAPLRGGGEALLDSAIMRPRMAEHYGGVDLLGQAALLATGISQAHAFVDGNKRTALHATLTFLKGNGCALQLRDGGLAMARKLERVAEWSANGRRDAGEAKFEAWLRRQPSTWTDPPIHDDADDYLLHVEVRPT